MLGEGLKSKSRNRRREFRQSENGTTLVTPAGTLAPTDAITIGALPSGKSTR
jgi:hypothetical protein